jgi:4-amino-4-deoxy-L-arabinose transferase-like glycosyltransferase
MRLERLWPLACVLPFLGFWSYGLFDLDEGFYAAVVADMMRRGDWITPTLNGDPWFEKPILAYWLAMPSVWAFGDAVGPRLPSVACTLATAWVLHGFLVPRAGALAARLATLAYCGSLLVVGIGRMMMTDAPLVLCLTLALVWFWRSVEGQARCRTWAGVAVGFGVLAKGPVAGLLVLATVGVAYWLLPEQRPRFRRGWWPGIGLMVAVLASWYVPCYLANGQTFVQKFLVEQNVGRFLGGDKAHAVPIWAHPVYFPAVLFLATIPWLFPAWRGLWRRGVEPWQVWLRVWACVPLVFFTVSGSKLPHYVLPTMPALAALIGVALAARAGDRPERLTLGMAAWCAGVLVLAQSAFVWDWNARMREVQQLAVWARGRPEGLAVYRIGRDSEPAAVSLDLQNTSHPSVLFYYHRPALVEDDPAVVAEAAPVLVLTRKGRIRDDSLAAWRENGLTATRMTDTPPQDRYEVWLLSSAPTTGLRRSIRTTSRQTPFSRPTLSLNPTTRNPQDSWRRTLASFSRMIPASTVQ